MAIRNHISNIDNEGQTLVEFALVVALLLAILFGIAEFGRAWFYSNHLTNSVRAAARYGAVLGDTNPTIDQVKDQVEQYVRAEIEQAHMDGLNNPPTAVNVNFVDVDGNDAPSRGDIVEVTVVYDFNFLVGSYFLDIFSQEGTVQLRRAASMRFEGGS